MPNRKAPAASKTALPSKRWSATFTTDTAQLDTLIDKLIDRMVERGVALNTSPPTNIIDTERVLIMNQ